LSNTDKNLALAIGLILVIASASLPWAKPVNAQTISKPSVPDFTVRFVDYSYDVPPTIGIDPFTGQNTITESGYHIANKTLEIKIKNQYSSMNSGSNESDYTGLLYTFRVKGSYTDAWDYYPFHAPYSISESSVVYTTNLYGVYTGGPPSAHIYPASDSAYTIVTIRLMWLFNDELHGSEPSIGSQIDLQVQAIVGKASIYHTGLLAGNYYEFRGEQSDWSDTQTVTIGAVTNSTVTPTPVEQNPTVTPSQLFPTNVTQNLPANSTPTSAINSQLLTFDSVPMITFLSVALVLTAIIVILSVLMFTRLRK
jgi:hypothetical protein